ncbi:MAG: hypothetical protein HYY76_07180 [Acidobacteria bacterium]|nr:hypothetical protein [Acidobacteriota bacterium]
MAALLVLVPGFLSAQDVPRQPYSESEVFKILATSIDQVDKWASDPPRGRHLIAGLRLDTGVIEKAWPSREKADDRPYLMGLTLDSFLLNRLVKDTFGPALQALEQVAEDLEIKASQVRRDGRLIPAVSTRVHTWEGPKQAGGYEVLYVLAGLAALPAAYDSFSTFSTPTDQKPFAPGRYLFWARKDGKDSTRSSRRLIPRDKAPIEIDLAVR